MKYLFGLSLAWCVIAPNVSYYLLKDKEHMLITLGIGIIIAIFSRIQDIAEFSMGPLKARMKEKLSEVDELLKELRKVGLSLSKASLTSLMTENFWGGTNLEKKNEIRESIIRMLKDIGANGFDLASVDSDWKKGMMVIYHREITWRVKLYKRRNQVNFEAPENNKKAGEELDLLLDFKNWSAPLPTKIKQVLSKHGIEISAVERILTDYECFLKTGDIKNFTIFEEEES